MARSPGPAAALLLLLAHPLLADRVRVEVEGLERDLERNVRRTLALVEEADEDLDAGRIRALHLRAPQQIEEALQPFGHYRPTVHAELAQDGDRWRARYVVDAGPVMRLERVDVQVLGEGADDPRFQELVRSFPLAAGDPLIHGRYEEGKRLLEERAAEAGYLDAEFAESVVRVDLDRYGAEVVVRYDSGPRYRFGDVRFEQDVVDPDILQGYVTFERGEPLAVDELLEMQDALSDSPYFSRVEVVPRRDQAVGAQVPIAVELIAAKPQRWTAGVGYGTDTGARASLGLELRRINRQGHRGESDLVYSDVERSAALRYMVPGPYPRTDVVTYSAGYAELEPETSRSRTALVGASLAQARGRWREAFALTYQQEDYTVGLDSGTSELVMPDASWTRVRSDDRLYPTRGERLLFQVRGAGEALGSNASFGQLRAEGKQVTSFAGRFRLLARARVGYTETDAFRELPPTIRFFAGGDQSVRGYALRSLGPTDAAGNVIGGERLLEASVEVDSLFFEKWGRWGAAVFYDTGNAMRTFSDALAAGAGVGVRWLSPVGLVRADAAWALDEEGTPVRFHLAIGPDL
jgi:translocation and assembly module TamA